MRGDGRVKNIKNQETCNIFILRIRIYNHRKLKDCSSIKISDHRENYLIKAITPKTNHNNIVLTSSIKIKLSHHVDGYRKTVGRIVTSLS